MGNTDFDACQKLWEHVFGDTKEYTDFYFRERAGLGRIYTESEGEKLVSMVHVNPYTMLNSCHHTFHQLHYIVGVATHPGYRHRGFMARLLTKALRDMYADGEPFTYLMPADPAIYTPFGFSYINSRQKECFPLEQWQHLPAGSPACRMETVTSSLYEAVSNFTNRYMQAKGYNYIFRDAAYYDILQKQMHAAGGDLLCYVTPAAKEQNLPDIHAVISYMLEDNHCEITEFLCCDTVPFPDIRYAFAKEITGRHHIFPKDRVRITLHNNQIMGRILDFKSFVKLLHAPENTCLSLGIQDSLLPENNGFYELALDKNGGRITSCLPLPQHTDKTKILPPGRVWEVLRPHLSEFCINDVT